jgi:hypothetical protein
MDVADTFLSAKQPDDNFGASRTLKIGNGNIGLLQFGQLNRAIVRGSQITDVKLVLHPVPGRFPENTIVELRRMKSEWRDGGSDGTPLYWTATFNAAMSSTRGNAVKWQTNGAQGDSDRLAKPSVIQLTSEGYNPSTNTWTITGPGLLADVRYWFGKQYRNDGWQLVAKSPKECDIYSSDELEKSLRPELVVTFIPLLTEGDRKGIDLNVTFISRTPRYLRYHDDGVKSYERKAFRDDNPGIMKFPVNGDTPKFPAKGETMTYTATIKNSGFEAYYGALDYVWRYNGAVIKQGTMGVSLKPEATKSSNLKSTPTTRFPKSRRTTTPNPNISRLEPGSIGLRKNLIGLPTNTSTPMGAMRLRII